MSGIPGGESGENRRKITFKGFRRQNRSQVNKNKSMPGHTQTINDKENSENSQRERTDHLQWGAGIRADLSATTGYQKQRVEYQ